MKQTITVELSAEDLGTQFVHAADHTQREFLIAMANAVEEMSRSRLDWHRQCEAIVNGLNGPHSGLSDKDRERIAYALDSLVDLLLPDKGSKP
jgi:hypothetical protein